MKRVDMSLGRVAGGVRGGTAPTGLVDKCELGRWRALQAAELLDSLCTYAKQDVSFRPRSSGQTTRWHCNFNGHEYELLCNGAKFYDTREARGGGGAVDLAMHLGRLEFSAAVQLLRKLGY